MQRLASYLSAILLVTASSKAQFVQIAPNAVSQSSQVTFLITDKSGAGMTLPSACAWFEIHQGAQAGPIVPIQTSCASTPVSVAAYASTSFQWDLIDARTSQPVAPGRYWLHTDVTDGTSANARDWFCFDVVAAQSAAEASIVQFEPAYVGFTTTFWVRAPSHPGELYATLLSFSQNAPLSVPGLIDLCLSAPVFVVDDGQLDASGNAPFFGLGIPADPALAYTGFHLQSLVVDAAANMTETNVLSVLIRP